MPIVRNFAVLVLVLAIAPCSARAQQTAAGESLVPVAPALRAATTEASAEARLDGPRVETARAGVRALAPVEARTAPAPMRRADTKQSRTYMILGGAALLGGAIIGDGVGSIIMLGGLGVGLYGLYLYLQ
ncbi:MAG: hypothetical protein IPJ78_07610 [Gemmatimonadetes bacterium]|nr:hypothetical protein [Gemmatimonadota bacterium]